MKKIVFLLLLAAVHSVTGFTQCDRKIILSASTTEYLNGQNELQNKDDRTLFMEYDAKVITITPGDYTLEGTVDSIACNWKTPYKEGKIFIKATLTRTNGDPMIALITIQNKEGKIILITEFPESPDQKLRFTLDRFEERK